MTIIARTDQSDYDSSNVNQSITLAQEFGVYLIIAIEYKPGWFGYSDAEVVGTYSKYDKAVRDYIAMGGQMRKEF